MKKTLLTFVLLVTFMLPMLAPLAPHDLLHNIHSYSVSHRVNDTHKHAKHIHDEQNIQNNHHSIHFDIVSYFNDYLNVDLQSPQSAAFKVLQQQDHRHNFDIFSTVLDYSILVPLSIREKAPPDYNNAIFSGRDVYLITQRMRI